MTNTTILKQGDVFKLIFTYDVEVDIADNPHNLNDDQLYKEVIERVSNKNKEFKAAIAGAILDILEEGINEKPAS